MTKLFKIIPNTIVTRILIVIISLLMIIFIPYYFSILLEIITHKPISNDGNYILANWIFGSIFLSILFAFIYIIVKILLIIIRVVIPGIFYIFKLLMKDFINWIKTGE